MEKIERTSFYKMVRMTFPGIQVYENKQRDKNGQFFMFLPSFSLVNNYLIFLTLISQVLLVAGDTLIIHYGWPMSLIFCYMWDMMALLFFLLFIVMVLQVILKIIIHLWTCSIIRKISIWKLRGHSHLRDTVRTRRWDWCDSQSNSNSCCPPRSH